MPIIFVYGIPDEFDEEKIEKQFLPSLVEAATSVKELDLQADQVSVFFPPDKVKNGLGEEIMIFVGGLFEKPERTEQVRNHLAQNLGRTAKHYFPESLIECFIGRFDIRQGFYSSTEF